MEGRPNVWIDVEALQRGREDCYQIGWWSERVVRIDNLHLDHILAVFVDVDSNTGNITMGIGLGCTVGSI